MKVYAVIEEISRFMGGCSEIPLGLYSTRKKARNACKKWHHFKRASQLNKDTWEYIFDDELTCLLEIKEWKVK